MDDVISCAVSPSIESTMLIVPPSGDVKAHCFRLEPKDELKKCLVHVASVIFARIPKDECSSLFVMTCVGSLSDVTLRLANASKLTEGGECNEVRNWSNQRFEIVSLVGTFSRDGACHLHLSMSDAEGKTFGGHLISGIVFTTAEIVIGSVIGGK
jgi:predicted DNA-binding protein with PD1-like motif